MSLPVSVVMPSHNRVETLRRVLAAYELQEPAGLGFELVVIDDGSSDGTAELLAGYRPRRFRLRFRHYQPSRGPAAARNLGLELARGERILFTGDDIEPAPDLLHQHLLAHGAYGDPEVAILGLTRWPPGSNPTATMRHIDGRGAQQFSYHFFEDGTEYDFRHLYTSNVSVDRRLLEREPAGFSTDFPAAAFEDAELGYRLMRHGLRIVYRQTARAYHHHHYDARGFFRRQERCGAMADVLYRKCPELRRFLDLEILENERLALALDRGAEILDGDGLRAAEERVLRLACFFDPLPTDAVEALLRPLFRYGYLRGLARGRYRAATAERLAARLFASLILPAVRRFETRLDEEGVPAPAADFHALHRLEHRFVSLPV